MTDDQNGFGVPGPDDRAPRSLPEFPMAGPPPPVGTPPPGTLKKPGAENWPWWYALVAFVGGFIASQMGVLVIGAIWIAASGSKFDALQDDATFVVVASGVSELLFVLAAVYVARMSGGVSFVDFGFVRAPFLRTVVRVLAVLVGYFVLLAVYNELVHLTPDNAPEKLGATTGTMGMLLFAVLVAICAPIAEEVFFRGMIYRALKNGIGMWGAAIISGLLFGSLHIDSTSTERLLQVVPLVVLGIAFALLYTWTGTLYSTIALHATNNAIAVLAFAVKHDSDFGIVLAPVIWAGMMVFCAVGHKLTDPDRKQPPPEFPGGTDAVLGYPHSR